MPEIVVIGGGLAGCWAATNAAASGVRVTLVRRALGATATSAGPLDFFPPGEAADPAGWLARLTRLDPEHPYVAGGRPAPSLTDLEQEAQRLSEALTTAGLPCTVSVAAPMLLAGITGQTRLASVAPALQANGDLNRLTGRSVAVAGIAGLSRFDPGAVAAALDERRLGWPAPVHAIALALSPELPGLPPDVAADLDDATLARALEAPGGAEALGAAIAGALPQGMAELVLLPAVLGIEHPADVQDRVSTTAGVPVAELLTPPPSAPGWRLQRACERVAAAAGVTITAATATAVRRDETHQRITAVELDGGTGVLPCDELILATGKYLGGGVVADPHPREPLLDLPLFRRDTPAGRLAARDLVDRTHFAHQPFAALGIRTDADGRPVDEHGHAIYGNVTACGDVLQGMDPTLSGGGLGVAAWTATRAARTATARSGATAAP